MYLACHECDLLQRVPPLPEGGTAKCGRCRAVLVRHKPNSIERTLVFAVTGLILFVLANAFPILEIEINGEVTKTTLLSAVGRLYGSGEWALAAQVFLTTEAAPLSQILIKLYVYFPLWLGHIPWRPAFAFRLLLEIEPWSMMGVFMLGVLVSVVKLANMAHVLPGISLWAFALLIVALAAAVATMDTALVWERLEARR